MSRSEMEDMLKKHRKRLRKMGDTRKLSKRQLGLNLGVSNLEGTQSNHVKDDYIMWHLELTSRVGIEFEFYCYILLVNPKSLVLFAISLHH